MVSRATFCQTLRCVGIKLTRPALFKLLDWVDPTFSGLIDWLEFVKNDTPPYYFNGKTYLFIREFFQTNWKLMLASCESLDSGKKVDDAGSIRIDNWMVIVENCLTRFEALHKGLAMSRKDLMSKISELSMMFVDPGERSRLMYKSLLMHYAGDESGTESLLSIKWELIWKALSERSDTVSMPRLTRVLCRPEVLFVKLFSIGFEHRFTDFDVLFFGTCGACCIRLDSQGPCLDSF